MSGLVIGHIFVCSLCIILVVKRKGYGLEGWGGELKTSLSQRGGMYMYTVLERGEGLSKQFIVS